MDKAASVNTEAHTSRDNLMPKAKISTRVQFSLIALVATYIVGDVSIGLWFWDLQVSLLFLIWSIPFFAVGWLVTGVPIIAAGDLVLRIPTVLVAVMGAAAGVFVLLLLPLLEWLRYLIWTTPGITHSIDLPWSYLKGWPAFCAALGAGGTMLYRWLISRVGSLNRPFEPENSGSFGDS